MVFRKLCCTSSSGGRETLYGENHNRAAASSLSSDRFDANGTSSSHKHEDLSTQSILKDTLLQRDLDAHHSGLVGILKFMSLCNTVVPSWVGGRRPENGYLSPSASAELLASDRPATLEMTTAMAAQPTAKRKSSRNAARADVVDDSSEDDKPSTSLLRESFVSGQLMSDSNSHHDLLSSETRMVDEDHTPSTSFRNSSIIQQQQPSQTSITRQPSTSSVAASSSQITTPRNNLNEKRSNGDSTSTSTTSSVPSPSIHYASSSPDELCLVEFAASVGVRLLEKEGNCLRILVDPSIDAGLDLAAHEQHVGATIEEWELLHVLEFSSERKRMSVVIRQTTPTLGPIILYTKGADDVIFARLARSASIANNNTCQSTKVRSIIDAYANDGLRTLCFASRIIDQAEYAAWSSRLHAATLDIHHRESKLAAAYDAIEHDLDLLGCTGIEDALGEAVPETIVELRDAGVKVWMLTGDRFATALEISKSCGLYKERQAVRDGATATAAASTSSSSSPAPSLPYNDPGDILYSINASTPAGVRASLDSIVHRAFADFQSSSHSSSRSGSHPPYEPSRYCLIIDGSCLTILLTPECEQRFALIALNAVSVICARTTPAQKASMVTLVKQYSGILGPSAVGRKREATIRHILNQYVSDLDDHSRSTFQLADPPSSNRVLGWLNKTFWNSPSSHSEVVLAIGDGGNDCAMILLSDVGIGILGKEGLQASRAADFSIAKFKYLKKLLFVHGRYAYNRTAFVSQYCFFKSMLICLVQLFFAFVSSWSGSSYFDSYSLVTYNLFYTSLPTLLFVFEKDLSETLLLRHPQFYASCREGRNFTLSTLCGWLLRAIFQAILLIAFATHTHHGGVSGEAFGPEGQISNALVIYTACVFLHPATIYLESTYITRVHHIVLGGTILLFLALNCALAGLSKVMDLWHIYFVLLTDGEYYLRSLLLTTSCLLPVLVYKYVQQRYYPTIVQQAHELELEWRRTHSIRARQKNDKSDDFTGDDYHAAPS